MSEELISFEYLLKGRLITSQDPSVIGDNFQSLKNMRYTDTNPEGIGGMTPINSTALTYSSMRNGYHFSKDQPSETHILIHTFDTSLANGSIYDHTTAVPSSGGFGSSALFTCSDATTERKGMFSPAPQSGVCFCDGRDSLIWAGNEMEIGSFVNYSPSGTFSKDYTDVMRNTLTDTDNIATLTRVAAGADADTKLLLHFDNNVTDSSTGARVVTNNGPMTFSAAQKVFGTHAIAGSSGAAQYLTTPDTAAFNFSGGVFTLDFRFRLETLNQQKCFYYQKSGAASTNTFRLLSTTDGRLNFRIKLSGSTVLNIQTAANTIAADTWYHGAVVESSSNYYMFVDGNLKANTASTARALDYTSVVVIGNSSTAGAGNRFGGYLDEFRVSNVARWTSTFQLPLSAYGTKTQTHCYLGARRPIKGFKVYMGGTANSSSAAMTVYEWQGAGWSSVASLTDNTSCGGRSMAKTGTVTFTSTVATSDVRVINDVVLYWYKIQVEGADDSITVSHVTNNAPMQQIKDLWDGEDKIIASCLKRQIDHFEDFTSAVFEDNYDVSSSATFMQLNSLAAITDYVYGGFLEQMMGLMVNVAPGYENTTANTILRIKYSSDGGAWIDVDGLVDGTSVNGISLAKSGIITWASPSKTEEFQSIIGDSDLQLWHYQLSWTQILDASVRVYYIAGIPAPKLIKGYKYPMLSKDRLWLLNNEDEKKNSAICCSQGLPEVWNGYDSVEFTFGDETELTGGASLFSIIGSNLYEIALFFKRNDLWGVSGSTPDDFVKYQIKVTDGLIAPRTLKTVINYVGGNIKPVAMWQGSKGIYMFDNHVQIPIHGDIENFFDPRESSNTRKLHASYIENSSAFVDEENMEYHWMFADASSTGASNREFAFDLMRGRWYEVNRGTGKYLQSGFRAVATNSNKYNFGLLNSGIMERLEYGNHFDGNSIAQEIWSGDVALDKGKIMQETALRKLKLISVSTTATSNSMLIKHYVDSNVNASSSFTLSPMRIGYRITRAKHSLKGNPVGTFHSIKVNMSTTNQTYGFSPIYLGGHYERVREDL